MVTLTVDSIAFTLDIYLRSNKSNSFCVSMNSRAMTKQQLLATTWHKAAESKIPTSFVDLQLESVQNHLVWSGWITERHIPENNEGLCILHVKLRTLKTCFTARCSKRHG
jgi:hypothetical protein